MATNTSADARPLALLENEREWLDWGPRRRGPVQDERKFQSVFDAVAQAIIEGRKLPVSQRFLVRPLAARTVALNYRPRP